MWFTRPNPKAWTEEADARELMAHVAVWIDRRLLVTATLAVAKLVASMLSPSDHRFFGLTEAWLRGEVDDRELATRARDLWRTPGHYSATYHEANDRLNVLAWEDEDVDAPGNLSPTALYAMFAADTPTYAVSYPGRASRDCVVYAAHALSYSARHPSTDFEEEDRPDWSRWTTEAILRSGDGEGREFVDNLRVLSNVIRDVIPYPRKGKLIARAPGMYVVRTKPGELGLQQTPRPPAKDQRPPRWWDGWIKGPDEDVIASIPDGQLMEQILRTIWPSSSRSSATSAPVPRVATSSAP